MSRDLDLAYIAGQLDADGCICVGYSKGKKPGSQYMYIMVNIVSQDAELLDWIISVVGGNRYRMGTARAYRWSPSDWESVLKELLPFLRTKKPQAELVLGYRERMKEKKRTARTPTDLEYQKYVYETCKTLNAKLPLTFPKAA